MTIIRPSVWCTKMTSRTKIRHVMADWVKASIFFLLCFLQFWSFDNSHPLANCTVSNDSFIQDTWSQSSHPFELLLMLRQGQMKGSNIIHPFHPREQGQVCSLGLPITDGWGIVGIGTCDLLTTRWMFFCRATQEPQNLFS